MEKKIWHRCKCTGQEFTQEEWCKYCQEHALGREEVLNYEGYIWNIHDMCLNPHIPVRVDLDGYYKFEVRIAKSRNGWSYGLDINCGTSGYGSGCAWDIDCKQSEKEAIHASLSKAREFAIRSYEAYKKRKQTNEDGGLKSAYAVPKYEKLIAEIDRYLEYYDMRQLELF